jgi:hypothetical protein
VTNPSEGEITNFKIDSVGLTDPLTITNSTIQRMRMQAALFLGSPYHPI